MFRVARNAARVSVAARWSWNNNAGVTLIPTISALVDRRSAAILLKVSSSYPMNAAQESSSTDALTAMLIRVSFLLIGRSLNAVILVHPSANRLRFLRAEE